VRDHFDRDHPDATIRDISEQTQGGVTHYTIRFEEQGVSREIQYDRDGVEMRPDVKLP
jgi:hypothetical protein